MKHLYIVPSHRCLTYTSACSSLTMLCVIFQVTEDEKVSTVKELVSERLNIPANQQRLLYKGKALAGTFLLTMVPAPSTQLHLFICYFLIHCRWILKYIIHPKGKFLVCDCDHHLSL